MPKPTKWKGQVADDGTPSTALRRAWEASLQPFQGRTVAGETNDGTRSNSANNYYWGFVVEPVRELFTRHGWALDKKQVHRWLKREFLGVTPVEVPSADLAECVVIEVEGTTRTDAWTFAEYVLAIQTHEPFIESGLFIEDAPEGMRGRTIHEPGGTKVTFRDPNADDTEAVEPDLDEMSAYEMQLRAAELW
ncbi:MAG: hypothetical protein AAF845_05610 [Bacteroidota bacterium]